MFSRKASLLLLTRLVFTFGKKSESLVGSGGAVRRIDVVLTHSETRRTLGIECKAQDVKGSAEEKIPATIQDISAWPIQGLVVFDGAGFSRNMRSFLIASGKAVEFGDLREWLTLFFGLPEQIPMQSAGGSDEDEDYGPTPVQGQAVG